ncbi:hypothetical protein D6853_11170 [Butyrivibrio sp. X503]|uniref:hypothetical protein n=1 Tax=Butyrivibrio sp. X503 TaxID=2364878 RepID=UPI000EA99439|nr:hypothetical protein [Butyrivibrio sp. X503]RKM55272.1 hypothetical protein D6853_11170 [Butyrivibrio sp. X503]
MNNKIFFAITAAVLILSGCGAKPEPDPLAEEISSSEFSSDSEAGDYNTDDKLIQSIDSFYSSPISSRYTLKAIDSTEFFDFNADRQDDLVVIADTNNGKRIFPFIYTGKMYMLDPYGNEEDEFFCLGDYPAQEAWDNGMDYTMDDIRTELLGDNADGVYTDYKDAYAQIAKIYNDTCDDVTFELVYVDDDDIPELYVDIDQNQHCSLYTFENDHARLLLDSKGLGWRADDHFLYFDRSGVIHYPMWDGEDSMLNHFFLIPDAGPLAYTYYSKDVVGYNDNLISDLRNLFFGDPRDFKCITDPNMDKKELEKTIETYEKYEWKKLMGSITYNDLMSQLTK